VSNVDHTLIEEHLPLVRHIVFQVAVHFPRHVDREELARAGALGLIEAAHRYDEARGVPFKRFAAQRIRGAILDFLRASDWAPRALRSAGRDIDQARTKLTGELGRTPTDQEIAASIGCTLAELAVVQGRIAQTIVLALDEHVLHDEEEDLTLVDVLCDPNMPDPSAELESREMRSYLRDAIDLLPERHRFVVVGYFLEGKTSDALARFLGVTESRVSQMRTEALLMLRDGLTAQFEDRHGDVTESVPASDSESGRIARRRAAYATAIASRRDWKARLAERQPALLGTPVPTA